MVNTVFKERPKQVREQAETVDADDQNTEAEIDENNDEEGNDDESEA